MSYIVHGTRAPYLRRPKAMTTSNRKWHAWAELVPDRDSAERRALEMVETGGATSATFEEATEAALKKAGISR